jgi:hypothetical protein
MRRLLALSLPRDQLSLGADALVEPHPRPVSELRRQSISVALVDRWLGVSPATNIWGCCRELIPAGPGIVLGFGVELGVDLELTSYSGGDPPFQTTQRFSLRLAGRQFAAVVSPAWCVVTDLHDGSDMHC